MLLPNTKINVRDSVLNTKSYSLADSYDIERCSWCYRCNRDFRAGRFLREHQADEHSACYQNPALNSTRSALHAKSPLGAKAIAQEQSKKARTPTSALVTSTLRCTKCPEGESEEFVSPADLQRHQRRVHSRRTTAIDTPIPESSITLGTETSPTSHDAGSFNSGRDSSTAQALEAQIEDTGLGFTRLASRERAKYRQRQGADLIPPQDPSQDQRGGLQSTKGSLVGCNLEGRPSVISGTASSSDTIDDLAGDEPEVADEGTKEDQDQPQVPKQRASDRPNPSSSSSLSIEIPYKNNLQREAVK